MRALITGAKGQLARELVSNAPSEVKVRAVSRAECDITEMAIVEKVFGSFKPDIVFNTAAYTAVDAAEDNEELAFGVNARGAENVARAAQIVGSRLIHISTDYVFDGTQTFPYAPSAKPNPLGVYGASKLAGEAAVAASAPDSLIVRTAWVYSPNGRNFLTAVLKLLHKGQPLRIVSDQVGAPTSASELSEALWRCALAPSLRGIAHWTNAGAGSWYEFACTIRKLAVERLLVADPPDIEPITSEEYPTAVNRPRNSVLDCSLLWSKVGTPSDWRVATARVMDQLAHA